MTHLRRAAIVAVGSEMLTPSKVDTNSLHITEQLNRLGVDVIAKAVVGDSRDELAYIISSLLERVMARTDLPPAEAEALREVLFGLRERNMTRVGNIWRDAFAEVRTADEALRQAQAHLESYFGK